MKVSLGERDLDSLGLERVADRDPEIAGHPHPVVEVRGPESDAEVERAIPEAMK